VGLPLYQITVVMVAITMVNFWCDVKLYKTFVFLLEES